MLHKTCLLGAIILVAACAPKAPPKPAPTDGILGVIKLNPSAGGPARQLSDSEVEEYRRGKRDF
jgi:hypothetical protein